MAYLSSLFVRPERNTRRAVFSTTRLLTVTADVIDTAASTLVIGTT